MHVSVRRVSGNGTNYRLMRRERQGSSFINLCVHSAPCCGGSAKDKLHPEVGHKAPLSLARSRFPPSLILTLQTFDRYEQGAPTTAARALVLRCHYQDTPLF